MTADEHGRPREAAEDDRAPDGLRLDPYVVVEQLDEVALRPGEGFGEIQQAQEEIKAMEREASDAKASRSKLAAIVQSVEVSDQAVEAHPGDKVELA